MKKFVMMFFGLAVILLSVASQVAEAITISRSVSISRPSISAPRVQNVYRPVPPVMQRPVLMQQPKPIVAAPKVVAPTPAPVKPVAQTPKAVAQTPKAVAPVVAAPAQSQADMEKKKRELALARERIRQRNLERTRVEQNNTIIQHNHVESTQSSGLGSMIAPALVGGVVGYMIGNSNEAHAAPAQPQSQYPVCPEPLPENWTTPCVKMQPAQVPSGAVVAGQGSTAPVVAQ